MTNKVEETKAEDKKIYSEAKGIYSLLDNNKVFQFLFPITSTLEENFVQVSFLKDKLFEAIQNKIKEEKEKNAQTNEQEKTSDKP